MALSAFATMTLLTKNSFLDEIRKQYVLTARAKGCTRNQVLYGHVFRNAMLIVIAGFPGAFVHAFFTGSLLIETIFSLDGLGLLGFESVLNRDYPVVFATLYIFSLIGAGGEPDLRSHLYLDRSAHRFRDAGGLDGGRSRRQTQRRSASPGSRCRRARRRIVISPINKRRWENFKANRRGYWSLWLFLALFVLSLFAEFIANDKPIFIWVNGQSYFPAVITYADTAFAKTPDPNLFGTAADYRDDYLMGLIKKEGGFRDLAAGPLLLQHASEPSAVAVSVQADLDARREGLRICRHAWLRQMRRA